MGQTAVLENIVNALMEFATPSMNPDDFVELERLTKKLVIHYKESDTDQISERYLMMIHPELSEAEASSLLKFCHDKTIRHKVCYGDGEIMFPMWKKSHG